MANIVDYVLRLTDKFSSPLDSANAKVNNFEKSFNGLGGVVGKVGGLLAGAFAIEKLGEFGKSIIEVGSNMEVTRIRFETLAGSAGEATKAIDNVSKLATQTPFEKTELLEYGQQLIGAGLNADSMASKLKMLGNISSATGKNLGELTSLYVKNKGNGLIQGEDLNQLADAKIPLQDFAAQLGTNVQGLRKLGSQGKVTFADLDKYFESLGGSAGKWGKMNEKISNTVQGKWSNLQDTITQMMSNFGESKIPFMSNMLDRLNGLLNWISDNTDKFADLFKPFEKAGETALTIIHKIQAAFGMAGSDAENFEKILAKVQSVMNWLGETLTPVIEDVGILVDSFKTLYDAVDRLSVVFTGKTLGENFSKTLTELGVKIQIVVDTITSAVSLIVHAFDMLSKGTEAVKEGKFSKLKELYEEDKKWSGEFNKKVVDNIDRYRKTLNGTLASGSTDYFGDDKDNAPDYFGDFGSDNKSKELATKSADTKATKTTIGDVAGTKQQTIIINLKTESLGIQNLYTTNMKESPKLVNDAIEQAVLTAIADAQNTAASQ